MGECDNIPALQEGQAYHAFIIHNSETERDVSIQLHSDLTNRGYTCCHADLNFQLGNTIVANIVTNIEKSRRVIAIISPQFLKSGWCKFEMASTLNLSYDRDRQILIPILYNIKPDTDVLPAEIKSMTYLEYNDPNFWKKLTDALVLDVPLAASIPAGNVAHGLAWSYFYGFLNLVLPNLGERVKKWDYWDTHPEALQQTVSGKEGKETVNRPRIIPKLIIVSPQSCFCPESFTDADKNIVFVGHIPFKASRAGNINRDYKNSVYKVTDPDTLEVYYAILEFATPILSLYEMEQGAIAGLNTTQKDAQRVLFDTKLQEILEHSNNRQCRGHAVLLSYRDMRGGDTGCEQVTRLSTVVVKLIRHELDKQTKTAAIQPQIEEVTDKLGQLHHGEGESEGVC